MWLIKARSSILFDPFATTQQEYAQKTKKRIDEEEKDHVDIAGALRFDH